MKSTELRIDMLTVHIARDISYALDNIIRERYASILEGLTEEEVEDVLKWTRYEMEDMGSSHWRGYDHLMP